MKKIFYIFAASLLVACSGSNEGPVIPDAYTEPFTLSVDTDEVEADGVSVVTFSFKDSYGREMLDDRMVRANITIASTDGILVDSKGRSVSFIDNGEHVFKARYNGRYSNEVIVTAVNRGAYEYFYKNIGIFKCTSVDCSACPYFVQAYEEGVAEVCKEHSILLAFHGDFQGSDPLGVSSSAGTLGNYILNSFGLSSWPGAVFDLHLKMIGTSPSTIEKNISTLRVTNPATCGIKVNSITFEGKTVKVNASLKSSKGGEYDLACALVEDGVEYFGGYSYNDSGIYNEVVRGVSGNLLAYDPATLTSVAKDEEITKTIVMNFSSNVTESALNGKYVAVWAHRKMENGESIMDNVVTCAYGSTTDYLLND